MTPETVAHAANLVRQMGVLETNLAAIDAAVENESFLAGGPLPIDNPNQPIDLPPLTAEESKAIFSAVRDVLGTRLKAITGDLAAM